MSFSGILGLEVEQLRDDEVRDLVVDLAAHEHDALAQQPGVDVERALAARVLLDDHGNQWHVQPPSCGLPSCVAYVQPCELLMPSVRREIVLPVEPERAWELMTEPAELEGWLADEVELEPEEGGDVRVAWDDGEQREGVVEEVEPERRLVLLVGRLARRVDARPRRRRHPLRRRRAQPRARRRARAWRALAAHASLCLA